MIKIALIISKRWKVFLRSTFLHDGSVRHVIAVTKKKSMSDRIILSLL